MKSRPVGIRTRYLAKHRKKMVKEFRKHYKGGMRVGEYLSAEGDKRIIVYTDSCAWTAYILTHGPELETLHNALVAAPDWDTSWWKQAIGRSARGMGKSELVNLYMGNYDVGKSIVWTNLEKSNLDLYERFSKHKATV